MKLKYISPFAAILLLLATQFLTAGCDRNEDDITSSGQQQPDNTGNGNTDKSNALCIVTTKQPFADETGTRASTDFGGTYATTFETGDEIGVIAVKDGAVLDDCNNVKLTYNATGSKWEGDNPVYFKDGATYIAYSPYRAVMDGKKSTQEIYDAFIVSTYQKTATQFYANDLMTSTTCTADKNAKTLTINFEHRLAMLEIKPVLQGFTGGNFFYFIKNSSLSYVSVNGGTSIQPFRESGVAADVPYRCILKPDMGASLGLNFVICSSDGGMEVPVAWSANQQDFTAGERRQIVPCKRRDIKVGDYYYSDGSIFPSDMSIFPSDMSISPMPGKDQGCIGVVFALGTTGTSKRDNISYYSDSGLKGAIHGYVVALENVGEENRFKWSASNTLVGNCTDYDCLTDYVGYSNTKVIQAMNGYGETEWPACWQATNYAPATPANSSGWFLPSCGQLTDMWNNKNLINNALTEVGGKILIAVYWSSSEGISTPKELALMVDLSVGVFVQKKSTNFCVRSCLAF